MEVGKWKKLGSNWEYEENGVRARRRDKGELERKVKKEKKNAWYQMEGECWDEGKKRNRV